MVERLDPTKEALGGVVALKLENQTEHKLLMSITRAFESEEVDGFFDIIFGRDPLPYDRDSATVFKSTAGKIFDKLYQGAYDPEVCDEGGYRMPGTLDEFKGTNIVEKEFFELLRMTTLVAIQQKLETPSKGDEEVANETIDKARLMTEILIGVLTEQQLEYSKNNAVVSLLLDRYIPHRAEYLQSVQPFMPKFERELLSEFTNAVVGDERIPVEQTEYSADIPKVRTSLNSYRERHSGLPWPNTV